MINKDLLKFRELLESDAEFQEKMRKATEAYKGETGEKEVFENLLLPLGQEYGLSATYEEFQALTGGLTGDEEAELSEDELAQVAGGKNSGYGACFGIGAGDMFGVSEATGNFSFYACELIGVGTICLAVGGR